MRRYWADLVLLPAILKATSYGSPTSMTALTRQSGSRPLPVSFLTSPDASRRNRQAPESLASGVPFLASFFVVPSTNSPPQHRCVSALLRRNGLRQNPGNTGPPGLSLEFPGKARNLPTRKVLLFRCYGLC